MPDNLFLKLATVFCCRKRPYRMALIPSRPPIENLHELPEEILLKIFKHLPLSDVLNVALTSKHLSEVINDNFYHLAPPNFRIRLNWCSKYAEWIGMRKYSSYTVESAATGRFLEVLRHHSDVIFDLHLNFVNEPMRDVNVTETIVSSCRYLKELTVNFANVKIDKNSVIRPVDSFRHLEKFDFYGKSKFMAFFMNFEVKIFKLRLLEITDDLQLFRKFLKSQKTLKVLKIFGYICPYDAMNLLFDDQLDFVEFRLEKLKIVRHPVYLASCDNFQRFLHNHKDSMTHFVSCHAELNLDFFKEFTKLKNLKILRSRIVYTVENPVVQHLIIKGSNLKLLECLPSIKSLRIIDSLSLVELKLSFLKHLESLELFSNYVPKLDVPSIQYLKINNAHNFDVEALPLFRYNIKFLIFNHCENISGLCDYLNQPETRLKLLRIENSRIHRKCMMAIRMNRYKIDELVLVKSRIERTGGLPRWAFMPGELEELFAPLVHGFYNPMAGPSNQIRD